MTDRMAALSTLSLHAVPERAAALDDFYERHRDDPLDRRQVVRLAGHHPRSRDAGASSRADSATRRSR